MHTHTDPHLEQLHVAVQLLREWADHCHNEAVTDRPTLADFADCAFLASETAMPQPVDRQALYRYGYAVGLEDAAAFLSDLLDG